jgi:Fic family protein
VPPDKQSKEIANLAEVRLAISSCVERNRTLGESLVLGFHQMMMQGVPEEPKHPTKPGRYRDATDDMRLARFKHLKKRMSPPWRIRTDVVALLEDAEKSRLPGEKVVQVGHFHYRFVRIHPFCDGNGRMARALSTLLHARIEPEILRFVKPVEEVILEHREDYVDTLEYCDDIYEEVAEENIPEEEKLEVCGSPFVDFYLRAFIKAFEEHNEKLREVLVSAGADVPPRTPPRSFSTDLSIDAIKASMGAKD